ncbi:MAG TPA: FAD:protein FMN transferase [Chthonomonadales bacterium]|nr:FAD:protein FMN transferase [Chthonomonadales bacterium]
MSNRTRDPGTACVKGLPAGNGGAVGLKAAGVAAGAAAGWRAAGARCCACDTMAALASTPSASNPTAVRRRATVRKLEEAAVRVMWRINLPSFLVWISALAASAAPISPDGGAPYRFQYTELHMGVQARIVLYASTEDHAERAAGAAFARIAALDAALSDHRPDSELMRLRDGAGGPSRPVSPDLLAVLVAAVDMARRSDGAFDPTVGPASRLWREARRTGRFPSAEALRQTRELVDWRQVHISTSPPAVRLGRPGMRLDLGGIAKGFALDRAMDELRTHDIAAALVEMGGDILVSNAPPGRPGWTVEVANPAPGARPQTLVLANQAVSSSGDTEQYVEFDGVRYSHIVDPRTALGLTSRIAATVVAPTATISDALSTAVSVLGPARGRALTATFRGARAYVRTVGPKPTGRAAVDPHGPEWAPPTAGCPPRAGSVIRPGVRHVASAPGYRMGQ